MKKITYFWIGFIISAAVSAWLYWLWRQKRVIIPDPLVISRKEPYQFTPANAEELAEAPDELTAINGIGPATARRLNEAGIVSIRQLAQASPDRLVEISGTTRWDPADWIEQARKLADNKVTD